MVFADIISGVPQDFILGTPLFNIDAYDLFLGSTYRDIVN